MVTPVFQFHSIGTSLRPFVLGIFSITAAKGELVEPQLMLPDGSCCLYLNFGEPLSIIDMDGAVQFRRFSSKILARGLLSKPHFLDCSLGIKVWGIKFRPDVWADLLGPNQNQNEYVSGPKLDTLFGELWDRCHEALAPERQVPVLVSGLAPLLPRLFPKANPAFLGVLEEIRYTRGASKLDEVLQDFDLPYKSVERYFRQYIGLTPKEYMKILRISAAVMEMFQAWEIPYLRLKDLGFFDLAHFFKEFRLYFSTTPQKILLDLPSRSLSLAKKVTQKELALMR